MILTFVYQAVRKLPIIILFTHNFIYSVETNTLLLYTDCVQEKCFNLFWTKKRFIGFKSVLRLRDEVCYIKKKRHRMNNSLCKKISRRSNCSPSHKSVFSLLLQKVEKNIYIHTYVGKDNLRLPARRNHRASTFTWMLNFV